MTLPASMPTPAVNAIANAPYVTTRIAGFNALAPPVPAPAMPSRTRRWIEPVATTGTSRESGAPSTSTSGSGVAAPMEKVAAEVGAACTGRVAVLGNAQLIPRMGAENAVGLELFRHMPRQLLRQSACHVDLGQLPGFRLRGFRHSRRSRARSACSVSDYELTNTYSPVAMDMAPAIHPARPASSTAERSPLGATPDAGDSRPAVARHPPQHAVLEDVVMDQRNRGMQASQNHDGPADNVVKVAEGVRQRSVPDGGEAQREQPEELEGFGLRPAPGETEDHLHCQQQVEQVVHRRGRLALQPLGSHRQPPAAGGAPRQPQQQHRGEHDAQRDVQGMHLRA